MSPIFTRDQTRDILRRQNVGEAAIERALDRDFGPSSDVRTTPHISDTPPAAIALPFRLVVPWSLLCSDNEKEEPGLTRLAGGTVVPRRRTSARYKTAKLAIAEKARVVAAGRKPTLEPLSIRVAVWLPPSRRNDAINFAKVVGDALEGIVYANDNQLHDSRWLRAGIDIDQPRAEIEIAPLSPPTPE